MAHLTHPPARQNRSRQTEARLLQAAEEVLEARGLEGAAVPEIAQLAGVSPASIYRRFTDKDGLLRAVFERFFAQSIAANESVLDPAHWKRESLECSIRVLVAGMVAGYTQKRGLLRAVIAYGEQHPSAAFRRRSLELRRRSVAAIQRIILLHRDEIQHPDPEKAVHFGMQLVALALKERIVPAMGKAGEAALSDGELAQELSRLLLGYLTRPEPRKLPATRKRAARTR